MLERLSKQERCQSPSFSFPRLGESVEWDCSDCEQWDLGKSTDKSAGSMAWYCNLRSSWCFCVIKLPLHLALLYLSGIRSIAVVYAVTTVS
jgi:hypothetical protein